MVWLIWRTSLSFSLDCTACICAERWPLPGGQCLKQPRAEQEQGLALKASHQNLHTLWFLLFQHILKQVLSCGLPLLQLHYNVRYVFLLHLHRETTSCPGATVHNNTRCCTSNAMFNILLFDFAYAGEVLALDGRRWNLKRTWNIFRPQWDWHSLHACTGSAGLCSLKPSCTMQTCAVGTEQMCSMLEVRWGTSTGSKKGNSCWSNPCFPRDSIASLITRSAPAALQEPHIDSLTPRGIWKSTACLQEAASPEGTSEWDSSTVPSALVLQCH